MQVAKAAIEENIAFMNSLGSPIPGWIRHVLWCVLRTPYTKEQVSEFVDFYSQSDLLTEQHMAGGCLFGLAIDKGDRDPKDTGKVKGTLNVHVADLSSVPLPRISPQMTAYLVGFHVAKRLA
jgi:GMC oxidoreductase